MLYLQLVPENKSLSPLFSFLHHLVQMVAESVNQQMEFLLLWFSSTQRLVTYLPRFAFIIVNYI